MPVGSAPKSNTLTTSANLLANVLAVVDPVAVTLEPFSPTKLFAVTTPALLTVIWSTPPTPTIACVPSTDALMFALMVGYFLIVKFYAAKYVNVRFIESPDIVELITATPVEFVRIEVVVLPRT